MILQIKTIGSKCLRKKTNPIKNLSESKLKLISNMKHTLSFTSGVGLAAPQVGSSVRIFIVSYGDFQQTFINPILRETKSPETEEEESCLSIPDVVVKVKRPYEIVIDFYNENMTMSRGRFHGFLARIIQHEYDHLEGKLITDYL